MATAGPTAFFVVLPVDPPTVLGPPGAVTPLWSYRGMGDSIFGYVVESEEVYDEATAAKMFYDVVVESRRADGEVGRRARVGRICDSREIEVEA